MHTWWHRSCRHSWLTNLLSFPSWRRPASSHMPTFRTRKKPRIGIIPQESRKPTKTSSCVQARIRRGYWQRPKIDPRLDCCGLLASCRGKHQQTPLKPGGCGQCDSLHIAEILLRQTGWRLLVHSDNLHQLLFPAKVFVKYRCWHSGCSSTQST